MDDSTSSSLLIITITEPLQAGQPDLNNLLLQLLGAQNGGSPNVHTVSDSSVNSMNRSSMLDTSDSSGEGSGNASVNESAESGSSGGGGGGGTGGRSAVSRDNSYGGHQMNDIEYPGPNDVMLGRGSGTSNHIGNISFRLLVNKHKPRYVAASRVDKPKVAGEVVDLWRKLTPPGRFLMRCDDDQGDMSLWSDVGDRRARQKTSQCLREKDRPKKEHERKRKRIAEL